MKNINVAFFSCRFSKIFLSFLFVILIHIPSFAQDYESVKAEKGDGAYALLRKAGLTPEKYIKEFLELNKENIGPGNSLYVGKVYYLPIEEGQTSSGSAESEKSTSIITTANSSGKVTTYEIFGEKYKEVVQVDNKLSGAVYYLVSGHGGPDPGAMGTYNNSTLCEDEYAYDVTLRLARVLLEHGALVYMITRDNNDGIRDESILKQDKDEKCYPNLTIPVNQVARLKQRTEAVNKLYVENKGKTQRMVVVHVDSRSKGENIDVFFYHDKRSKTGEKLAKNLQQTFKEKYDTYQPNRGYQGTVSTRSLYVIRNSYPPCVYIELGNINHTRDQKRFILADNRQALANWLSEGLIKDFNNNK